MYIMFPWFRNTLTLYINTTVGTASETLTTYISDFAISLSSPSYPGKHSVHEKSRYGFTAVSKKEREKKNGHEKQQYHQQ